MHLGTHIKIARIRKGLTQEELAERIHKTRPLISTIEQSGRGGHDTLRKVCKALDLDPKILEHYEDFPNTEYPESEQLYTQQTSQEATYALSKLERENLEHKIELLREIIQSKDQIIESLQEQLKLLTKKK